MQQQTNLTTRQAFVKILLTLYEIRQNLRQQDVRVPELKKLPDLIKIAGLTDVDLVQEILYFADLLKRLSDEKYAADAKGQQPTADVV